MLSSRLPHPVQVPKKINNLLGILNRRTVSVSGSVRAESEKEETLADNISDKMENPRKSRGKYSSTLEVKKRSDFLDTMGSEQQITPKDGKSFNTLSFAGEDKSMKSSRSHSKIEIGQKDVFSNKLISATYDGRKVTNNPVNLSRLKAREAPGSSSGKWELHSNRSKFSSSA